MRRIIALASQTVPRYLIDREPALDKSGDTSGPRIRCPLSGWTPREDDLWYCFVNHLDPRPRQRDFLADASPLLRLL